MSEGLVVVAAFTGMDEAVVARGMLEQEGIETFLANEHLVTLAWTLSQATGGVRLAVGSQDAERARKILASAADGSVVVADSPPEAEPAPAEDELPSEADLLIERAWKSSLVGFLALPPLFHLWALWLLRRAYAAGGPGTARARALAGRTVLVSGCAACAFAAIYLRIFLR
jgi:hypothetical protein